MMHVCLFLGQFFFQDEPYGLSFINLRSPPDASEQQEEAAVSTGLDWTGGGSGGGGGGRGVTLPLCCLDNKTNPKLCPKGPPPPPLII